MTVNAAHSQGAKGDTKKLRELTTCLRMSFKPKECLRMVIKKEQVHNIIKFRISNEVLPTVSDIPRLL